MLSSGKSGQERVNEKELQRQLTVKRHHSIVHPSFFFSNPSLIPSLLNENTVQYEYSWIDSATLLTTAVAPLR